MFKRVLGFHGDDFLKYRHHFLPVDPVDTMGSIFPLIRTYLCDTGDGVLDFLLGKGIVPCQVDQTEGVGRIDLVSSPMCLELSI